MIDPTIIEQNNATRIADLTADYDALGARLDRRGVDIQALTARAMDFGVALPSWGTGTGGTRFARFPGEGEPATIMDKLDDCGTINQLTAATPTISLHIPWDKTDPALLREKAQEVGLGFDAMNSNSFQDQADQTHSYKFGSLSHISTATQQNRPSNTILNVSRSGRPSGRAH